MADNQASSTSRPVYTSLTIKITGLATMIMVAVVAILATGFIVVQRQRTLTALMADAKTYANFAADSVYDNYIELYTKSQTQDFATFKMHLQPILGYEPTVNTVRLLSTKGEILFDSNELKTGQYSGASRKEGDAAVLQALKSKRLLIIPTAAGTTDNQIVVPIIDAENRHQYSVQFTFGYARKLEQQVHQTYVRTAAGGAFLVLTVAAVMAYLSTRLTKPIKILTATTQKIAVGDLTQRVPEDLHNEYGQLASSFNVMADKLQQVYEGLERKIAQKTEQLAQKVQEVEAERVKDEALLSSIGEGMIALDADGRVVRYNSIAASMLSADESSLNGRKITETLQFFGDKGEDLQPENQPGFLALHYGQKTEDAYQLVRPDKSKVVIAIISSPIRLQQRTVGVIMVLRDITKEREVDRMKTEFISLASHQLRTPLSAIRWFTEMLITGDAGQLTPQQMEFAQNVASSTDRMIQLISSLLNISRIESGRIIVDPQPTDLQELVAGIVNDLQAKIRERNQHLAISVHEGMGKISLDPRLIGQVYLNLLTNAIKYTPKGGNITVMVSKKEGQIISQVSDNGYGIPKAQQDKMFQKFFRADNVTKVEPDGTGLGMYLVKAIIESSGGQIWFESEEGKGTTFWFTVPAAGMKAKAGEVTLDG